ncbi:hypothetical protein EDB85DRAFT_2152186 [Lactarius pseudohatsudake]|nr:hypothetical protein EDB85DRAFT_2152186 [Lactarius pseudohatsudake]
MAISHISGVPCPALLAARHRLHLQMYSSRAATAPPTAGAPEPSDPALIRHGARPALAAARPCPRLEHFSAAAQLVLYRTLELSADDADACVARLAGAPHLAALVTTLTPRAYPSTHSPSFVLALALRRGAALRGPGTLTHLTLLADTLPYAFFTVFSPHPRQSWPRGALAPGRPLRRVTLHIASTLYDGLRPAALFGALGGALKELVLVLAPDVDVRTLGRLLGRWKHRRGTGGYSS